MTGCHKPPLCIECYSQLKFITTPYCSCCGMIFPAGKVEHLCGTCLNHHYHFSKARSIFNYEKIIAGLIHNIKYYGKTTSLNTIKWLVDQSNTLDDFANPDYIIPVPLHFDRLQKRGFNQSLLLARIIFPDEKQKIRYNILIRNKKTPFQTNLSGKERRKNLKNAFHVDSPEMIINKNILLIDDVLTTGTTVDECAKTLKKAGCKRVEVLTICRADKNFY